MEHKQDYLLEDQEKYTSEDVKYAKKLVTLLQRELDSLSKEDYSRRVFSPMMHGFIDAEFIVDPQLPENLKVGMFEQPGKIFKAKLRYASAYRKNKILRKDVRTLAVRVYHEERESIQDFLMGSSPYFRARNVKQTYQGLKILFNGGLMIFLGILFWPYTALMALKSRKQTFDLFNIPFYSQTAYTYGHPDKLVKYIIKPRLQNDNTDYSDKNNPDFLKNVMKRRFQSLQYGEKIVLDFFLQFQTANDKKPGDPMVVWNGSLTHVATIQMSKQNFDTEEMFQEGQSMEFNVGNSLPEHKYYGAMNWARHIIYQKLSEYRKDVRNRQLTKADLKAAKPINEYEKA